MDAVSGSRTGVALARRSLWLCGPAFPRVCRVRAGSSPLASPRFPFGSAPSSAYVVTGDGHGMQKRGVGKPTPRQSITMPCTRDTTHWCVQRHRYGKSPLVKEGFCRILSMRCGRSKNHLQDDFRYINGRCVGADSPAQACGWFQQP